jgi:hypothetical protein
MPEFMPSRNALIAALCGLALCLGAAPTQAQSPLSQLFGFGGPATLPDATRFGARMELGDVAAAHAWLDAGLNPDFMADRTGTGLMIAAAAGNIALMELFAERGANPNKTNTADEQALMHAAWRGRLDAVKWLLAHGAKINREPMKWTALHYAVFAGHEEVAAYLIEQGADINARSTNGSSVLMMAVFEGRERLARRLLDRGADTAIKNDNGDGALEWAFKFKHPGIARMVTDQKSFAEAAELPQAYWGEVMRSVTAAEGQSMQALAAQAVAAGRPAPIQRQPLASQIDDLLNVRTTLAARGMTESVQKVDKRIEQLRAAQERARLQAQRAPAIIAGAAPASSAASGSGSEQIDALMDMRATLAARGMTEAVEKLDRRIASLRARRAKPDLDAPDGAVLRITGTRPGVTQH